MNLTGGGGGATTDWLGHPVRTDGEGEDEELFPAMRASSLASLAGKDGSDGFEFDLDDSCNTISSAIAHFPIRDEASGKRNALKEPPVTSLSIFCS